jgi:hypothetical protein
VLVHREEKKEETEKPRTVNKAALAKKIKAQLDGIDLLQKLTLDLVRLGIGNMNAKSAREVEEQAKQLGNTYLPGAQAALHNYTKLFTPLRARSARPRNERRSTARHSINLADCTRSSNKAGRI